MAQSRYCTIICLEEMKKTKEKKPLRIAGLPAKILTDLFPDTSLECY
jgi:hypothetical protein